LVFCRNPKPPPPRLVSSPFPPPPDKTQASVAFPSVGLSAAPGGVHELAPGPEPAPIAVKRERRTGGGALLANLGDAAPADGDGAEVGLYMYSC
jgi:hypothetical protein